MRDWKMAKPWLLRALRHADQGPSQTDHPEDR